MTTEQAEQLEYIYNRMANVGTVITTCVDLGTGTSFNVKAYEGYNKFTANNFLINSFATGSVSSSVTIAQDRGEYGWGQVQLVKSYDANTGVLSAYIQLQVQTKNSSTSSWDAAVVTKNVPVQVYIVF